MAKIFMAGDKGAVQIKIPTPMTIKPFEPPARWHAVSESRGKEVVHVVDVLENHGFGKCSCEDFQFRCQPALDDKRETHRCKHLVAAREAFADLMIAKLLEVADQTQ